MCDGAWSRHEMKPEAEIGTQYRSNSKRIVYLTLPEPKSLGILGMSKTLGLGCRPLRTVAAHRVGRPQSSTSTYHRPCPE